MDTGFMDFTVPTFFGVALDAASASLDTSKAHSACLRSRVRALLSRLALSMDVLLDCYVTLTLSCRSLF